MRGGRCCRTRAHARGAATWGVASSASRALHAPCTHGRSGGCCRPRSLRATMRVWSCTPASEGARLLRVLSDDSPMSVTARRVDCLTINLWAWARGLRLPTRLAGIAIERELRIPQQSWHLAPTTQALHTSTDIDPGIPPHPLASSGAALLSGGVSPGNLDAKAGAT